MQLFSVMFSTGRMPDHEEDEREDYVPWEMDYPRDEDGYVEADHEDPNDGFGEQEEDEDDDGEEEDDD